MLVRKLPSRKLFYPSRRGGSPDTTPAAPFALDEDPAPTYRSRPTRKLVYPSRRGGSPDNNAPTTPLGIDEDPWQQPRQRFWKLARAFTDDEVYVNNASEDYLWIAIQTFFQAPLVAFTDEEVLPTPTQFGLEDDSQWFAGPTAAWKRSGPFLDDDECPIPAPVATVTESSLGGSKRKKIRGPYSDPLIYDEYIKRCIAEREAPRINVETAFLKEALVAEVEQRAQNEYIEFDALAKENQLLKRLLEVETTKRDLEALVARQRQIERQVEELEDEELRYILNLFMDM